MKNYLFIVFIFISILVFSPPVDAASFQLIASTNQVAPGQTFTVQVGGDCIGKVDLTVSNGVLSTNSVWVEQGYISVNVTAGSSGVVLVTATPVMGFSDSDANLYQPGSRTITMNIVTSSQKPTTSPLKPTINNPTVIGPSIQLSEDNQLSSLTVSDGTLEPAFDSSNTEYSLNLGPDTTKIQIDAIPSNENATIEGLGEISLNLGNNCIELVVTAENGEQKIYKIHVYVDDAPQIYLDYQKQKIGIVRNLKDLEIPEGFEKEDYSIQEKIIPILTKGKITLIYGINSKKEKQFYLYDKDKSQIIYALTPLKINERDLYIIDKQFNKDMIPISIIVDEEKMICYQFRNYKNDYCLLSAINTDGKIVEYLYEKSEGTVQLYPKFLFDHQTPLNSIGIYILGILLFFTTSVLIIMVVKQKKGKKYEKTK